MTTEFLWVFRAVRPSDESLVYSSWLKSYRDSPVMAGVPNTVYYKMVHELIERTLATATVLVACNQEDPEVIYGYIVYEPGTIHWTYVKHPFRSFGIGKALENAALVGQEAPVAYTCRTRVGDALVKKRAYLVYNPFLFLRK